MRTAVVVFFLFGLIQPALAITKCEQKGKKVLYKKGTCPENASTKYLVNDKFVTEEHLQQHQQKRSKQSAMAFKEMNTPIRSPDDEQELEEPTSQTLKPEKVQMSNETTHFKLQKVDNGTDQPKGDKINVPGVYDGVNVKLTEMERKLEQRNQELKKLQQK